MLLDYFEDIKQTNKTIMLTKRKELQTIINLEITSILRKNCVHLFVGDLGLKDLHLYILEMKNAYSEFMTDDKFLPEI